MKIIIEADSLEDLKTMLAKLTEHDNGPHINTLNLTTRATSILLQNGITTVPKLLSMSDYDLLHLPTLGKIVLKEIKEAIKGSGHVH